MVRFGFFNAKKLITGAYDRKYNAEDINTFFKGTMSRDGIYQFVGNQCRVVSSNGMNVVVRDGKGQVNYHWFEISSNENVEIKPAHATLNRWTAVIVRYDGANRSIYLTTVDGEVGEKPSKPKMERSETIRDICLAYVYVAAGATEITSDDIIDTIENDDICGYIETLLSSSDAGVRKTRQLPPPSKKSVGEIFYLTQKNETQGKVYSKGYYCCEPSEYTYFFKEKDFITDIFSNVPNPSKEYEDILFYATDIEKWLACKEMTDDNYSWETVEVLDLENMVEPSDAYYDNYYICDGALYYCDRDGSTYEWFSVIRDKGGATTITVPTDGWITETDDNDEEYYYVDVNAEDIASNSVLIISLHSEDNINMSDQKRNQRNFNKLFNYECGDGLIRFFSKSKPTTILKVDYING